MFLIELIPKLLFCHHVIALFHLPIVHTINMNCISPPHLFPFYLSEVSEPSKINVYGIGRVSEKVTLVSENMLYVSEILAKMTYNLKLF